MNIYKIPLRYAIDSRQANPCPMDFREEEGSQMATSKEWLRASDLAGLLGMSRSRVYQLIAEGRLPAIRQGRSIRIPTAAWQAWLEDQRDRALSALGEPEEATES